ncbi:MAG: phosphoenolpyruvate carboxylase [Chlamydiia bacterium]|nr:phosphoenolpyruvate carboxylase [Chlamydiia bacterium]
MDRLTAYDTLVRMKYELYNSLFLTLPFPNLEEVGIKLPLFTERCREGLEEEKSPKAIIDEFFIDIFKTEKFEDVMGVLFLFTQFLERQVLLFDALEQAAFSETHGLKESGSLGYALELSKERSLHEKFSEILKHYRARIVLTAHPTQFYPEVILEIIDEFSEAIQEDDLLRIEQILFQLGMTSFRNLSSPTPLSEAKGLLNRTQDVFYEAILDIEKELSEVQTGKNPALELGFWPCGDRDGNPYVDVKTTLEVAEALRDVAFAHYRNELKNLKKRLTFPGMAERLGDLEEKLERYSVPEELLEAIEKLEKVVVDKHQGLFQDQIEHFKLAVKTFGFHFAGLDLRQDSSQHEEIISELYPEYSKLDAEEKTAFLEKEINSSPPPREKIAKLSHPLAEDFFGSFEAIQTIQKRNGPQGLERYIISHTQSPQHVLEVLYGLHCLGLDDLPLDITPLFETVNDLKNAPKTLKRLYDSPVYQKHLKRRGNRQIAMVGFSDGTKDGGYLTCNVEILKAKKELESLSQAHGVDIVFFDGRGGPPARGGGNTRKFYRALGENLKQNEIQLTVQGQTISSNFGSVESARFNLEQIFTAGLEARLFSNHENSLTDEDFKLLDALSDVSLKAYSDLRNHSLFLRFMEERTPLNYFTKLNVASRPAKRGKSKNLDLNDLRAIPFVGAWSQIRLSVPGFYGLGTALKWAYDQGDGEKLEAFYKNNLFFSTLIENSMQALAKSSELFTTHLLKDPVFKPLVEILHEEAVRTRKYLLKVSGQKTLLEDDPLVKQSIELREKLLLPLLVIQQYAMGELKSAQDPEHQKGYEKLLLKTLPSIINASRNSA